MPSETLLWTNIALYLIAIALILVRRDRPLATAFSVLALISFACTNYLGHQTINNPENIYYLIRCTLIFEVLAVVSCYFFAKTSFRDNANIYKGPGFWLAVIASLAIFITALLTPVESFYFSTNFGAERVLFLTSKGYFFYIFLFLFLVFGLVQLERTIAAIHQLQRWGIKFEVIGIGLLMASFAFYFGQSFLYRSINLNYLTARLIVGLLALGMIIYSQLFRRKGASLALSPGIAHRSFVLLIVGGYLILLGIVGEGLRYLEIPNAKDLFYVVLMLSSLGLAIVFLSERLRRRLKVFLHKNFYKSKYDYREQWEKFSKKVASSMSLSETQAAVLDLLCTTFACKGAVFYLRDEESNDFTCTASFNFNGQKRRFEFNSPLINELRQKEWTLNLTENNPNLGDTLIEDKFFLVVPLFFDEELVGFIALGEQINSGEVLTYEDYDLLRMFAKQAISTVQGQRLSDQLAVSRELAAIGNVSTFVLHDLKNQVSGLALMLDNARNYSSDPNFQEDMLETVSNTVDNMTKLIARLKNLKGKPEIVISPVKLSEIIQKAVESTGGNIQVSGDEVNIAVDRDEIYKVVLNLLVNALDATGSDGPPVKVVYGLRKGSAFIEITDFGCGMSAEQVENRLFVPFKTTKKHGFGIGLYQCKQVIEMHHGSITVHSKEGEGTTFLTLLPLSTESM